MGRKISKKLIVWGIWVSIAFLITISPILIALLGVGLAELLGCSGSGPGIECAGQPALSSALTTMVLMHWFGLMTLPIGLPITLILFVIFLVQVVIHVQKKQSH